MEEFLTCLEKYDLLIELILTISTIFLSVFAVFQTKSIAKRQLEQEKNIAKQQADLQEKQIKISVYEQKNEINKALDEVFNIASAITLILPKIDLHSLSKEKVYCLLNCFIENVNTHNISYILGQSRFFLNADVSANIRFVRIFFGTLTTSINMLNLLDDDEIAKDELIDDVIKACADIEEVQSVITSAMIQELKLVD